MAEANNVSGGLELVSSAKNASGGINWANYSKGYDLLDYVFPVYRQNIQRLIEKIQEIHLPANAKIVDLGAGTGNYVVELAKYMPKADVLHVDSSQEMNQIAKEKYRQQELHNVKVTDEHIQNLALDDNSLDLVVCVNVLYSIFPQQAILNNIRRWLKPNGYLFIIDFGREQSTLDWGKYIFQNALKERKVKELLHFIRNGREVMVQAFKGAKHQRDGGYWMHSTEEFESTLKKSRFKVLEIEKCYLDFADYAFCSPL